MQKSKMTGAPSIMKKRGENTDNIVLEEIKRNPNSSIHGIAEQLSWTNGKVDGSINRLLLEDKIKVRYVLKRGILQKKVYPIDFIEKPASIIEIPKRIVEEEAWTDRVEAYALSRSTIALSPYRIEDYDKRALLRHQIPIKANGSTFEVNLSNQFSDFYQLENSETGISAIGDVVLVTVESTIPVDVPLTHSIEYSSFDRYSVFFGWKHENAYGTKGEAFVLTVEYDGSSPIEQTLKQDEEELVTTNRGEQYPLEIKKLKSTSTVSSEFLDTSAINEIKVV